MHPKCPHCGRSLRYPNLICPDGCPKQACPSCGADLRGDDCLCGWSRMRIEFPKKENPMKITKSARVKIPILEIVRLLRDEGFRIPLPTPEQIKSEKFKVYGPGEKVARSAGELGELVVVWEEEEELCPERRS